MQITASHLKQLGVIDTIVTEPIGGAHRAPEAAIKRLGDAITESLQSLNTLSRDEIRASRRRKFLSIGAI